MPVIPELGGAGFRGSRSLSDLDKQGDLEFEASLVYMRPHLKNTGHFINKIYNFKTYIVVVTLCTGDQTQGFVRASQMLYHTVISQPVSFSFVWGTRPDQAI